MTFIALRLLYLQFFLKYRAKHLKIYHSPKAQITYFL